MFVKHVKMLSISKYSFENCEHLILKGIIKDAHEVIWSDECPLIVANLSLKNMK